MTTHAIDCSGQNKDDILSAIRAAPANGTCLKLERFVSDWPPEDIADFFQAIPEHDPLPKTGPA